MPINETVVPFIHPETLKRLEGRADAQQHRIHDQFCRCRICKPPLQRSMRRTSDEWTRKFEFCLLLAIMVAIVAVNAALIWGAW